jgi:hypothetical protein
VSPGEHSNKGPHGIPSFVIRVVERVRSLPEGARVVIYSGAILLGIAISIGAIVYRGERWRAFMFLLGVTLATLVLGGLGYAVLRLVRYNQIKREAAQRSATEAQLLGERQRAEMLRAVSDGEIKPLSDTGGLFLRNSESLWYRCAFCSCPRITPLRYR